MNPRSFIILLILTLTISVGNAVEQSEEPDTSVRRGKFFTPEEGAAYMKDKLDEYPTRESWECDVPILREEILKGMGMVPLPKRTPLKPEIRGKRVMDGYTVENAVFQSNPGLLRNLQSIPPEQARPLCRGH